MQKVSVIIPTYNYARFLNNCINSVITQSYENTEIIVVDDGSTDNTREVISVFGNRINYIYQENQGLSSARNTGLLNAGGEYIQFLDSDDILHKDAIKERVLFLEKNPEVSIAVCRNKEFSDTDKNGNPIINGHWKLPEENLDIHLCYLNIAPPHAFLIRRKVAQDVGTFDKGLKACEDYDYWLRSLLKGHVPVYCPRGLVYYRKHPESMSSLSVSQLNYDIILNKRQYEAVLNHCSSRPDKCLPSALAFLCGIIRAEYLSREHGGKIDGVDKDLRDFAFKSIKENIREGANIQKYETYYYFLLLLELVRRHFNKGDEIFEQFESIIAEIIKFGRFKSLNNYFLMVNFAQSVRLKKRAYIFLRYIKFIISNS